MSGLLRMFAVLFVLLSILYALVWWNVYKFKECRKVGHSVLYCLVKS